VPGALAVLRADSPGPTPTVVCADPVPDRRIGGPPPRQLLSRLLPSASASWRSAQFLERALSEEPARQTAGASDR
jgi:hypothetical protein